MSFQEKINEDIKAALRKKDELRLSVLRMTSAALHNKSIEKRAKGGKEMLTEEETIAIMRSEVKKRRDAAGEFTRGNRPELAAKELEECLILQSYLPQELSDEEIEKNVTDVVVSMGSVSEKEFGKVMGEVMKRIRGQASGDRVQKLVRDALSQ